MARRLSWTVGLVLVAMAAAVLFVGAATPTTAGDQSISLNFDAERTDAAPGERVELHVVAETDGGVDGEGVRNSTLRLVYPGEYLDVVAVEPGGFMQDSRASLVADRRVNNSVGVLEFDQNLPSARNGVIGQDYLAHVTVEVADDAPPSTLEVGFEEPYFELAVSGFPLAYNTESTEIAVDGGGERVEPAVAESVQLDDDALPVERSGEPSSGANRTENEPENADDNGAGFGVVAGLLGVVAIGVLVGRRVRSRR